MFSRSSRRSEASSSSRKHKSDSSSSKSHRRGDRDRERDRSPSRKSTRGDDRDDDESVYGPPSESMISAPRTTYFETSTPWPSSSKKYDTPEDSLKTRKKRLSSRTSPADPADRNKDDADKDKDEWDDESSPDSRRERKSSKALNKAELKAELKPDAKGKKRVSASSGGEKRSAPETVASTVPNQFPGQAPQNYATPDFDSAGYVGAAADYYGNHNSYLQAVADQPGLRPHTPVIAGLEPHLMTPTTQPAPPQETGNGTAAEFYATQNSYESYQSTTMQASSAGLSRPSKPGPSAAIAAGLAGVGAATLLSTSDRPSSGRPSSKPSKTSSSITQSNSTLHHHQLLQHQHSHMQMSANSQHPQGIMNSFVDWWRDWEDVHKMEEWTEFIGVCRYCFDHRAAPGEGPRVHRPNRRSSREFKDRRRVDKDSRYYNTEEDKRKRSSGGLATATTASAAAGLAAYGLSESSKRTRVQESEYDDYAVGGTSNRTARRESSEIRRRRSLERKSSRQSSSRDRAKTPKTSLSQRLPSPAGSSTSGSSSSSDLGFFSSIFSPGSRKKKTSDSGRRHSGGIYRISNASVDTGLAYGGSTVSYNSMSKTRHRRRSSDHIDPTKTLLGLGTATAALAAVAARRDRAQSEKLRSEGRFRQGIPPSTDFKRTRNREDGHVEEDEWEDASENASDASSTMAFGDGLPSSPSTESLSSNDSGTGKWGWRWGGKKQRRASKVTVPTAEATGLAALGAGLFSTTRPDPTRPSPAPLKELDPVPIQDSRLSSSSRRRRESLADPILTSRPSDVPLQHPKPVSPPKTIAYPATDRIPGSFPDNRNTRGDATERTANHEAIPNVPDDYRALKRQTTEPLPSGHRHKPEDSKQTQRRRRTSSPTPEPIKSSSEKSGGGNSAALASVAAAGAYALGKRNEKDSKADDSTHTDRRKRQQRRDARSKDRKSSGDEARHHAADSQKVSDEEAQSPPASAMLPNKSFASITPSESASRVVAPYSDMDNDNRHHHDRKSSTVPHGEPIFDDEIFDPNFFKKRSRSDSQTEAAAQQVFEDFNRRYQEETPTMAEFFAPKEILAGPAPVDRRVDTDLSSSADESSNNRRTRSNSLVPKLQVIPPTPDHSQPPSAHTKPPREPPREAEKNTDASSYTASRVRWGDSEINVYQPESPESFRDSEYFSSTRSTDSSPAKSPDGLPTAAPSAGSGYREPYAESVSDANPGNRSSASQASWGFADVVSSAVGHTSGGDGGEDERNRSVPLSQPSTLATVPNDKKVEKADPEPEFFTVPRKSKKDKKSKRKSDTPDPSDIEHVAEKSVRNEVHTQDLGNKGQGAGFSGIVGAAMAAAGAVAGTEALQDVQTTKGKSDHAMPGSFEDEEEPRKDDKQKEPVQAGTTDDLDFPPTKKSKKQKRRESKQLAAATAAAAEQANTDQTADSLEQQRSVNEPFFSGHQSDAERLKYEDESTKLPAVVAEANAEDEWESTPRKKDRSSKRDKKQDGASKPNDSVTASEDDWQSRASKRRAERRSMDLEARPALMKPAMTFADTVLEIAAPGDDSNEKHMADVVTETMSSKSNGKRREGEPKSSEESDKSKDEGEPPSRVREDAKSSVSAPLERSATFDDYILTSSRRDRTGVDTEPMIGGKSSSRRSHIYSPERRPKGHAKADDYSFTAPPMTRSSSDGPQERHSRSTKEKEKEKEKEKRRSGGIFSFLDRQHSSSPSRSSTKGSTVGSTAGPRDDSSIAPESRRSRHDKSSKRLSLNDASLEDYGSVLGSVVSRSSGGHSHKHRDREESTTASRSATGRRRSEDYETGTTSRTKDFEGTVPRHAPRDSRRHLVINDFNESALPTAVPLPDSRPDSPTEEEKARPPSVPSSRPPSATAVPLRFRKYPGSPVSPVSSPTVETDSSPLPRQRPHRPPSTEFKSSHEFRPLYLLERTRKPAEVEDNLPSLPSSHSNSRTSSVQGNSEENFVSARETPSPDLGLDRDLDMEQANTNDFLGSEQSTPKAGSMSPKADSAIKHQRRKSSESQSGILAAGGLAVAANLAAVALEAQQAAGQDSDQNATNHDSLDTDAWAAPVSKTQKKKDKKAAKRAAKQPVKGPRDDVETVGDAAQDAETTPKAAEVTSFEITQDRNIDETVFSPNDDSSAGLGLSIPSNLDDIKSTEDEWTLPGTSKKDKKKRKKAKSLNIDGVDTDAPRDLRYGQAKPSKPVQKAGSDEPGSEATTRPLDPFQFLTGTEIPSSPSKEEHEGSVQSEDIPDTWNAEAAVETDPMAEAKPSANDKLATDTEFAPAPSIAAYTDSKSITPSSKDTIKDIPAAQDTPSAGGWISSFFGSSKNSKKDKKSKKASQSQLQSGSLPLDANSDTLQQTPTDVFQFQVTHDGSAPSTLADDQPSDLGAATVAEQVYEPGDAPNIPETSDAPVEDDWYSPSIAIQRKKERRKSSKLRHSLTLEDLEKMQADLGELLTEENTSIAEDPLAATASAAATATGSSAKASEEGSAEEAGKVKAPKTRASSADASLLSHSKSSSTVEVVDESGHHVGHVVLPADANQNDTTRPTSDGATEDESAGLAGPANTSTNEDTSERPSLDEWSATPKKNKAKKKEKRRQLLADSTFTAAAATIAEGPENNPPEKGDDELSIPASTSAKDEGDRWENVSKSLSKKDKKKAKRASRAQSLQDDAQSPASDKPDKPLASASDKNEGGVFDPSWTFQDASAPEQLAESSTAKLNEDVAPEDEGTSFPKKTKKHKKDRASNPTPIDNMPETADPTAPRELARDISTVDDSIESLPADETSAHGLSEADESVVTLQSKSDPKKKGRQLLSLLENNAAGHTKQELTAAEAGVESTPTAIEAKSDPVSDSNTVNESSSAEAASQISPTESDREDAWAIPSSSKTRKKGKKSRNSLVLWGDEPLTQLQESKLENTSEAAQANRPSEDGGMAVADAEKKSKREKKRASVAFDENTTVFDETGSQAAEQLRDAPLCIGALKYEEHGDHDMVEVPDLAAPVVGLAGAGILGSQPSEQEDAAKVEPAHDWSTVSSKKNKLDMERAQKLQPDDDFSSHPWPGKHPSKVESQVPPADPGALEGMPDVSVDDDLDLAEEGLVSAAQVTDMTDDQTVPDYKDYSSNEQSLEGIQNAGFDQNLELAEEGQSYQSSSALVKSSSPTELGTIDEQSAQNHGDSCTQTEDNEEWAPSWSKKNKKGKRDKKRASLVSEHPHDAVKDDLNNDDSPRLVTTALGIVAATANQERDASGRESGSTPHNQDDGFAPASSIKGQKGKKSKKLQSLPWNDMGGPEPAVVTSAPQDPAVAPLDPQMKEESGATFIKDQEQLETPSATKPELAGDSSHEKPDIEEDKGMWQQEQPTDETPEARSSPAPKVLAASEQPGEAVEATPSGDEFAPVTRKLSKTKKKQRRLEKELNEQKKQSVFADASTPTDVDVTSANHQAAMLAPTANESDEFTASQPAGDDVEPFRGKLSKIGKKQLEKQKLETQTQPEDAYLRSSVTVDPHDSLRAADCDLAAGQVTTEASTGDRVPIDRKLSKKEKSKLEKQQSVEEAQPEEPYTQVSATLDNPASTPAIDVDTTESTSEWASNSRKLSKKEKKRLEKQALEGQQTQEDVSTTDRLPVSNPISIPTEDTNEQDQTGAPEAEAIEDWAPVIRKLSKKERKRLQKGNLEEQQQDDGAAEIASTDAQESVPMTKDSQPKLTASPGEIVDEWAPTTRKLSKKEKKKLVEQQQQQAADAKDAAQDHARATSPGPQDQAPKNTAPATVEVQSEDQTSEALGGSSADFSPVARKLSKKEKKKLDKQRQASLSEPQEPLQAQESQGPSVFQVPEGLQLPQAAPAKENEQSAEVAKMPAEHDGHVPISHKMSTKKKKGAEKQRAVSMDIASAEVGIVSEDTQESREAKVDDDDFAAATTAGLENSGFDATLADRPTFPNDAAAEAAEISATDRSGEFTPSSKKSKKGAKKQRRMLNLADDAEEVPAQSQNLDLSGAVLQAMGHAGEQAHVDRKEPLQTEGPSKTADGFSDLVFSAMSSSNSPNTTRAESMDQKSKPSFDDIVSEAMDQAGFDMSAVSRKTSKERLAEDRGIMDFGPASKDRAASTGRRSPSSIWQSSTSLTTTKPASPKPSSTIDDAGLAEVSTAAVLAAGAFADNLKNKEDEAADEFVPKTTGRDKKKTQLSHETPHTVEAAQIGGGNVDQSKTRDFMDSSPHLVASHPVPGESPVQIQPDTKDRSSDLFKSPPSNRTSTQSKPSPRDQVSPDVPHGKTHGRSASRELPAIREESPSKGDSHKHARALGDQDAGPEHSIKVPRRLRHLLTAEGTRPETDIREAFDDTVANSPSVRERAALFSGPPSPSDIRRANLAATRPPSSNSNTGNARVAEAPLRSLSALSNRSGTPGLRRMDRSVSSDLRNASVRDATLSVLSGSGSKSPDTPTGEAPHLVKDKAAAHYAPLKGPGKDRQQAMSDTGSLEAWGGATSSPRSPSRPQSVRKRQSTHILDLERQLEQVMSENRQLQEIRDRSTRSSSEPFYPPNAPKDEPRAREIQLREKDVEISSMKASLSTLQAEVARLSEHNNELQIANANLSNDTNDRYAALQKEHSETQSQWTASTRELQALRTKHSELTAGMESVVRSEIDAALADKDDEISRLRRELERATERIQSLQQQVESSHRSDDFLHYRDEDYFDSACQQLCQHVQQWVLRFSKFSDTRACRLSTQIKDEKIETRLDNAILDGSEVDDYLRDRVRRRDVFMSLVMTMVWEFVFTRYLFGMDRDQRQKLKSLEKTLTEVGPARAVAQWRAITLTLLSQREAFQDQKVQDSEAVVQEIFSTLSRLLPPPGHLVEQVQDSLRNVMRLAVNLSVEMRTQRAEYIMLPPLQPEYDTNGNLARKVFFNASLMNERSGQTSSNEELERQQAVVRIVLFPLVVKKGDDVGETDDEMVVCPAQVLVARPGTDKKAVRVTSGPTNASTYSIVSASVMDNAI